MKRVLVTGMSGTGKSTVVAALAARGCRAIDADEHAWSHWVAAAPDDHPGSTVEPGRDWVWREDRIAALLAESAGAGLVVSGCAANMRQFLPQFDHVVLLTAPDAVLLHRLATRSTNNYGKRPEEAARVLELVRTIEPRLRSIATEVIETTAPIDTVVERVLNLVRSQA